LISVQSSFETHLFNLYSLMYFVIGTTFPNLKGRSQLQLQID